MAVRYQCDRCGRMFDDMRDFKHVAMYPSRLISNKSRNDERKTVDADICADCARLLEDFMESVC